MPNLLCKLYRKVKFLAIDFTGFRPKPLTQVGVLNVQRCNMLTDIIFVMLGWLSARFIDKLGKKYNLYQPFAPMEI